MKARHEEIVLTTRGPLEFVDLTESVAEQVSAAGVANGIVNVQTRHTTTTIVVNENEPLLIEDMQRTLESLAPRQESYRHDDLAVRTVNLTPEERENGHSHCRALFSAAPRRSTSSRAASSWGAGSGCSRGKYMMRIADSVNLELVNLKGTRRCISLHKSA